MSSTNFDKCLAAVLQYEGGYTNNIHDPGGATNRGITQRVYDAYRRSVQKGTQDVRVIATEEVTTIYRLNYWTAVRGDDLPSGIDECVFDEAVNSGPVQAIKDMQRVLRVGGDGQIGILTLDALKGWTRSTFINAYCDNRLTLLHHLRNGTLWKYFGSGWGARIAAVRKLSIGLSTS